MREFEDVCDPLDCGRDSLDWSHFDPSLVEPIRETLRRQVEGAQVFSDDDGHWFLELELAVRPLDVVRLDLLDRACLLERTTSACRARVPVGYRWWSVATMPPSCHRRWHLAVTGDPGELYQ